VKTARLAQRLHHVKTKNSSITFDQHLNTRRISRPKSRRAATIASDFRGTSIKAIRLRGNACDENCRKELTRHLRHLGRPPVEGGILTGRAAGYSAASDCQSTGFRVTQTVFR